MRPPFNISLWTADGTPQLLNTTMGLGAAQQLVRESVSKLHTGEVIRVTDAMGASVYETGPADPDEVVLTDPTE
jgi:hypothetical protein